MVDSRQLAVIGAGRLGSAMAYLAHEKGYKIVGLCAQHIEKAKDIAVFLDQPEAAKEAPGPWLRDAYLVLITTPDDLIEKICAQIAGSGFIEPGTIIAHCSGAHPSSILKPAVDIGCLIGSIHPLQSCATKELAIKALPGSFFCVEGMERAKKGLKDLILAIGGRILEISTVDKPLYHAGAVVSSNFLVSLINFALTLYESIGIDRAEGIQALTPLLEGTIKNIETIGIPEALTGPIMRGDLGTVRKHLDAIKGKIPRYIPLYCALGIETVRVAISKGTIDETRGEHFQALFGEYKDLPLN